MIERLQSCLGQDATLGIASQTCFLQPAWGFRSCAEQSVGAIWGWCLREGDAHGSEGCSHAHIELVIAAVQSKMPARPPMTQRKCHLNRSESCPDNVEGGLVAFAV